MQYKKKRKKTTDSPVAYNPEKWEIEQDLQALGRASGVRKDPERMKKVQTLAKQKIDENKRKKEEVQEMIDLGTGEVKS